MSEYTSVTISAFNTSGELKTWSVKRRKPEGNDVYIKIQFCGMCHSDVHQIRGEWEQTNYYPMTPGHEMVGIVQEVGSECKKFKVGDRVGVGCWVDSCRKCEFCLRGDEQYCSGGGPVTSYNAIHKGELTHGGYSTSVTCSEDFVVRIPDNLPMGEAAPLLCAGITTYSPLVHFGAKAGGSNFKVGVLGLGGLGTMAVKIAKAMGNQVIVLSRGEKKRSQAEKLGAKFINSGDPEQVKSIAESIDLVIDTISADHPVKDLLKIVKTDGRFCLVGLPPHVNVNPFALVTRRLSLCGSMVGGIQETQEMLEFCAAHGIVSDVELIHAKDANHAVHNLVTGNMETSRYVIKIEETLNESVEIEKEPEVNITSWEVRGKIIPPEANIHA